MHKKDREPPPPHADHLSSVSAESKGIRGIVPVGLVLIPLIIALTFLAPNVLWFLLYPLLVLAALAALTLGAALLLRHL